MHVVLKIIGWILIAMQILSIYGTSMGGGLHFGSGVNGLMEMIGYFSFGIVGVLLIIAGNKLKARAMKKAAANKETSDSGNEK